MSSAAGDGSKLPDLWAQEGWLCHNRTNLIYSHPDLALQKAASDAIWQRLQAAKQKLERMKKEGDQTSCFGPYL